MVISCWREYDEDEEEEEEEEKLWKRVFYFAPVLFYAIAFVSFPYTLDFLCKESSSQECKKERRRVSEWALPPLPLPACFPV